MKIPASKVPAQVWADKARRRGDLDEVESMLLSSWDDSKQVYRIGKELWDELRIDEADEVPVDALSVPMAVALLMSPVAVNPGTAFADTTQVTICAAESDGDEKEAGSYGKTGGIGLAPAIAILGASSVACLTLAHRLGKGDDGEISDV